MEKTFQTLIGTVKSGFHILLALLRTPVSNPHRYGQKWPLGLSCSGGSSGFKPS